MAENGTTGYRPPVCSSGGDDAMPSTSRAGMEEASASLENNGRILDEARAYPWNTLNSPTDATYIHGNVVENKRTDAASVSRKRQAWEKIEDEFNCRHNVTPRKWIQLKKCWENLKDKWRRTNAEDMRERFATGCQDMYDESTDLWSWDDNSSPMEDASTNTARPHGQVQDTSDSQPRNGSGAKPSEAAAVPSAASSSAAAAASSSAAVPAGTKTRFNLQQPEANGGLN
ncbi:hypothetical protein HPB49_025828 [Dermacentor silvarum]|nr:hypothetical protein HPB49_025828 [Dermacentor silvarum]